MPKKEKVKVNVKERVDDNICDLSLSQLNDVPVTQIAAFKRVTVLDLSSNRLTSLGKNFVTLTRLVKLDLSKNQLKTLPDDFGLLSNLKHLDLYDNRLEHLPLSFSELHNLRYLDLKGNPLLPALVKIVGHCLTSKECYEAAKNTVKFMSVMQLEAEKIQQQYRDSNIELQQEQQQYMELPKESDIQNLQDHNSYKVEDFLYDGEKKYLDSDDNNLIMLENAQNNNQKTKKSNKKIKTKGKQTQGSNTKTFQIDNNKSTQMTASAATTTTATMTNKLNKKSATNPNANNTDNSKAYCNSSTNFKRSKAKRNPSTAAFASIFTFFLLLLVNIFIIYLVMFKNPEVADKLVEFIPHQYRDWILTKTEIFRLRVTDWITQFQTPPEEH